MEMPTQENAESPRRQLVLRLYTERSLPIPIRDPSYHQSRPFGLRCNCVFVYMQAFKAANVMSSHRSDPCCSSSKDTATRKSLRTLSYQRNFVILTSLCREERELGRQLLEWTTRVVIIFLIFDI